MPDDWMQMTEEEVILPIPYTRISMDIECDRALGSVHVDGEELVCPWTSWMDNEKEIKEWLNDIEKRRIKINDALVGTGLECIVSNILDKVINPRGLVMNFQIRQKTTMATKDLGGMKVPDWYKPTEWPTNNPDGDEFQKIVSAGCFPEIPPP